ncbi:putative methyltransferase type 11 [Rosellinia necatrix]|uniref:Putative methyltransferase type 11 n=1 Tax=Rosellinia necatrix TaxID=77044 RepID=A0A1W2TQI7_ROSNE|nr:putative methyltransferase type 11 [Rosellinia necatrix]
MAEPEPKINHNPKLQSYYASLESVLGYDLLLGGTRHFGYYEDPGSYNPFPLSASLRRMEAQLAGALRARPGARVLDAGCGNGHVARYMARERGLHVTGIDVVERHVRKAQATAARLAGEGSGEGEGTKGSLEVRRMDYHHLETLPDASLDAAYTMETLVHATDPAQVLAGLFRVLKPGGRVAMHEYDNVLEEVVEAEEKEEGEGGKEKKGKKKKGKKKKRPDEGLRRAMRQVNEWSAMPTNAASRPGALPRLLEEAGFVDVRVRDLSAHIRPMTRLFYALAIVPFLLLVRLLGLERRLVNTVAGVGAYRGRDFWRYIQIVARKPGVGALVDDDDA